jgi:hypothetical protein
VTGTVDTLVIPSQPGLDGIVVYWHNYEPGKGMVTIVCFGAAWNTYFGGMSGETIQKFFNGAGADYLANALTRSPHLMQRKRDLEYVTRIVKAVKVVLKESA